MGSTGIEALKPTPGPSRREGRRASPQPPPKEGELRACEELGCTLFVLPSFGGVGGGFRGLGEPFWGGCTTYLYLVKIKIHLMINSLVCVPSPF